MKLYALDLETGGLRPAVNGITEIAAVVCDYAPDWGIPTFGARYNTLVQPHPNFVYELEALQIQGRTLEDLAGGKRIGLALTGLVDFVRENLGDPGKAVMLAHNAPFDADFTLTACKTFGVTWPFDGRAYLCSSQLFRHLRALGHHNCQGSKLDTVVQHYGVSLDRSEGHKAFADVEACAICYGLMMQQIAQRRAS